MRLVQQFVDGPRVCNYLPEETAQLEVRVLLEVSPAELESMLERGWRRFGPVYFRPVCAWCAECVTLRVPTATFAPSKSQRRAARGASALRRVVGRPVVDDARLALYRAWHTDRERARRWDPNPLDAERYALDFSFPHPSVREVSFYDGAKLVGLGIADETPRALSAAFFFYDPAYASLSLGVANVVMLIEDARARGIPHLYLGYRVRGCASLAYKETFLPHELLIGRPRHDEPARWRQGPD